MAEGKNHQDIGWSLTVTPMSARPGVQLSASGKGGNSYFQGKGRMRSQEFSVLLCRQLVHHGCAYYMHAAKVTSQVSPVKSLARSVAFASRVKARNKSNYSFLFCTAYGTLHIAAHLAHDQTVKICYLKSHIPLSWLHRGNCGM